MAEDPIALKLIKRHEGLAGERRSVFDVVWQQLAQYHLPNVSDINTQKTEGVTGWTDLVYDTTSIQDVQICAAGILNWTTPATEQWFEYIFPHDLGGKDKADDEAQQWLSKATQTALMELARSNFYSKTIEDNLSLCAFGTGALYCEEGKRTALNFKNFKVGTYTCAEDDEEIIDTFFREMKMTVRQAVQKFGADNWGEKVKGLIAANKWETKIDVLHAIMPREDAKHLKGKLGSENKPIASIYIDVAGKCIVEEGGYDEMPVFVSRFSRWGQTVWGYSPAFLMLPEVRQINYVVQYRDALTELYAYPRMLYPSSLSGEVDLRPGGITVYDDTKPDAVPREWMTQGKIEATEDILQQKREMINKAFFVNLFQMLDQLADKRMTAYEISQRVAEKLEGFTPFFHRYTTERINPLLKRVFAILLRQGKLGQPPASLLVPSGDGKMGMAIPDVVMTSRVAMAMKATQNNGIMQTLQVLQEMVQVKPEILDNFDTDELVRTLARNNSVPANILIDKTKMEVVRQQRAKMQQQQMQIEQAQGIAKAGKDIAKAPKGMQDQMMGG